MLQHPGNIPHPNMNIGQRVKCFVPNSIRALKFILISCILFACQNGPLSAQDFSACTGKDTTDEKITCLEQAVTELSETKIDAGIRQIDENAVQVQLEKMLEEAEKKQEEIEQQLADSTKKSAAILKTLSEMAEKQAEAEKQLTATIKRQEELAKQQSLTAQTQSAKAQEQEAKQQGLERQLDQYWKEKRYKTPSSQNMPVRSKWRIQRFVDPIYNQDTVFAELSDDGRTFDGLGNPIRAKLYISCTKGSASFVIDFFRWVSDGGAFPLVIRIDNQRPMTLKTRTSTNKSAVGFWNSVKTSWMIKQLVSKNKLSIQTRNRHQAVITTSFDILGLEEAIVPVAKACKM